MTFEPRLIVVALAAFGAAGVAGAIAAAWIAGRLRHARGTSASTVLQIRILPAAMSVLFCMAAIASFERFEPRAGVERTGLVLWAFALLAIATVALTLVRLARAYWTTRRALRRCLQNADRISLPGISIPAFAITSAFPIVAVVGVVRRRLIVARSVLEACSPEEMTVIVAHERSHLRRHDNARRVLMSIVPDVLVWTGTARRLADLWQTACEDAADAEAAAGPPARRIHLAEALIRVARLAPAGAPALDIPASALYRGENIERRVRRLLDPSLEYDRPRAWRWQLPAAATLLTLCLVGLHPIHELVEAAVAYLP